MSVSSEKDEETTAEANGGEEAAVEAESVEEVAAEEASAKAAPSAAGEQEADTAADGAQDDADSEGDADAEADFAEDTEAQDAPLFPGEDGSRPGLERSLFVTDAQLASVLESLIFVADAPVKLSKLARLAKRSSKEVRAALAELEKEYAPRGIQLVQLAGGYQFRSSMKNAPFVREFVSRKPVRLSRAQMEALSIVAYRQPVTRPEVDEIRGVDSGSSLRMLAERDLVKILGRKEEAGRPLLYGTTPHFLEFFGLASLKDLPTLKEFTELSDESRGIFERRMGDKMDLSEAERQAAAAESEAQEAMFGSDLETDEQDADESESSAEQDVTEAAKHDEAEARGEKPARSDGDE